MSPLCWQKLVAQDGEKAERQTGRERGKNPQTFQSEGLWVLTADSPAGLPGQWLTMLRLPFNVQLMDSEFMETDVFATQQGQAPSCQLPSSSHGTPHVPSSSSAHGHRNTTPASFCRASFISCQGAVILDLVTGNTGQFCLLFGFNVWSFHLDQLNLL